MRKPSRFPRLGGAAELSSGLLVDSIAPETAQQKLPLTPATELCVEETSPFALPPFCGETPKRAQTTADSRMSLGDICNDDVLVDDLDFVINPDTFDLPCDESFVPSPPETFYIKFVPT